MKNIFELAEEEKESRNYRINRALCIGVPRGIDKFTRCAIAQELYNAKWDGNDYHEANNMTYGQILENFCWNVFGASLEEVLIAWDRYLG